MAAYATSLKVGDGLEAGTTMGPLVNAKRVNAMERLVQDAREHKARVVTGGERIGNRGNFSSQPSLPMCRGMPPS